MRSKADLVMAVMAGILLFLSFTVVVATTVMVFTRVHGWFTLAKTIVGYLMGYGLFYYTVDLVAER